MAAAARKVFLSHPDKVKPFFTPPGRSLLIPPDDDLLMASRLKIRPRDDFELSLVISGFMVNYEEILRYGRRSRSHSGLWRPTEKNFRQSAAMDLCFWPYINGRNIMWTRTVGGGGGRLPSPAGVWL